jgi:hypothetical protein
LPPERHSFCWWRCCFGGAGGDGSALQPAAIAEAAKRFGQEDDITVVTIARDAAIANAA